MSAQPPIVSKTDFLLYRECPKNAWLKKHRPEIFYAEPMSDFDKAIIDNGIDVENQARKLFPTGKLIENRDEYGIEQTQLLIKSHEPTIFQAVFSTQGFMAAIDVMKYDEKNSCYDVIEIKASSEIKKDWHPHDLAFQVILLNKLGINVGKTCIMYLNSDYVRGNELDITQCFKIDDIKETVNAIMPEIEAEMERAKIYLTTDNDEAGCSCLYKTRSNHCTTFAYSNPSIPEYGVHDITRIGKKKLTELIDSHIYKLEEIPEDFELTDNQRHQVDASVRPIPLIRTDHIRDELNKIHFPIYFLDYETYACAIPRFTGYSPYTHIPFQYSLHVLDETDSIPRHYDFLHTGNDDPGSHFLAKMREHIGNAGTVIVWYKPFECGRNKELAKRHPDHQAFLEDINSRVYDLRDVFTKLYYVHKDFRGGTSIKDVLPVLVPNLSYKKLAIREGGTASQKWNEMIQENTSAEVKKEIEENLKKYCELDTYAMYAIWKHLYDKINGHE